MIHCYQRDASSIATQSSVCRGANTLYFTTRLAHLARHAMTKGCEICYAKATMSSKKHAINKTRTLVTRLIWYIVGVIAALLALRIVLLLLNANAETPFVDLVYSLSNIFVVPFSGIFAQPDFTRVYVDTSSIIAIVVYWIVGIGLAKLINLDR